MDNELRSKAPAGTGERCPVVDRREKIEEAYSQYLMDESRLQGTVPERIYFPRTTGEVAAALSDISQRGETVTVSGARTGIVGGAAPQDTPNLISLENVRMPLVVNRDSGGDRGGDRVGKASGWVVRAGAGTTLE